jgi:hypothetical protein
MTISLHFSLAHLPASTHNRRDRCAQVRARGVHAIGNRWGR